MCTSPTELTNVQNHVNLFGMVNPFSTKFWSAGVLPFQFTEHMKTMDTLLETSRQHPICQIIGPHGSGKSTLLLELLKQYEANGENVRSLFFNDQYRKLPDDLTFQKNQILFVDGFEQLPLFRRLWLLLRAKRLILTAHRPMQLIPVLYRAQPQFAVFVHIVQQLMPEVSDEAMLQAVYDRSGGNFRNAFFELYDQWENDSVFRISFSCRQCRM